jgi:hypothetical protein
LPVPVSAGIYEGGLFSLVSLCVIYVKLKGSRHLGEVFGGLRAESFAWFIGLVYCKAVVRSESASDANGVLKLVL